MSATILGVRRDRQAALAADGQVTLDDGMVVKRTARSTWHLGHGTVLCGVSGSTAEAAELVSQMEERLEACAGSLREAAERLVQTWRAEGVPGPAALLADRERLLMVLPEGAVLEPDDGVAAVGPGAPYAVAAARALIANTSLDAEEVAREAMRIAADLCAFMNHQIRVETIEI